MEPVQIQDDSGSCLSLLEDAGCYFSPNVEPDHILDLQNFKARNDDVLVVSYPKSGTHWVSEIVSMLVKDSSVLLDDPIMHTEYVPMAALDSLTSPRVMCSHLPLSRVPLDFLRKRAKIVVCVRNPRDVCVSYFRFISTLSVWDYSGDWDSFLPLFLEGKVPYNSWFKHVDSWLDSWREGKHNVHLVFYEDLHSNFDDELRKLARFLGVELSKERLEDVKRETRFENMKKNKLDITLSISKTGQTAIYKNGRVGDWGRWFTPEQVGQMDEELEACGLHRDPKFKYSLDDTD
ncbi:sulfotransferase family cytosolic 1B member 1 [Aplysia californica]|uniref:Sulfotransferase family cytosolic 1B member 1 n=1 Tax=Aplysia californica TaxID=6500 RepID=A0ABM0ZUZ8_APLCA|nr:sulfotransferase family cytosolic 1B member 1 [Aplysia californica]